MEKNDNELLKKSLKKTKEIATFLKRTKSFSKVDLELNKLNFLTSQIDVKDLTEDLSLEILDSRYSKCLDLQKNSEKILTKIKKAEYETASIIQVLRTYETDFNNLNKELQESFSKNKEEKIYAMSLIIQQDLKVIEVYLRNGEKLIEKADLAVDIGVKLFKNYLSKIVKLKKEKLK